MQIGGTVSKRRNAIGVAIISLIFAMGVYASCKDDDASQSAHTSQSNDAPHDIQPEMYVTLKDGAFSCMTKDQLAIALKHIYRHEETLFKAMFSLSDDEGYCIELGASSTTYKVLAVDGSISYEPDMMQITKTGEIADAIWANSAAAIIANPLKRPGTSQ